MNKAILVGRLTRDPEVRYSQSENPTAVARYTVAVDRRFKRDGEPTADFIPCVVFGRSAEFAEKYFRQGMRISAESRAESDANRANYQYQTSAGTTPDEGDGFMNIPDGIDDELPFH